jgi:hypothetical protein
MLESNERLHAQTHQKNLDLPSYIPTKIKHQEMERDLFDIRKMKLHQGSI